MARFMDTIRPQGRRLKYATAREVAVRAKTDPRTVQLVAQGEPLISMSRERAYRVLLEMRLIVMRDDVHH